MHDWRCDACRLAGGRELLALLAAALQFAMGADAATATFLALALHAFVHTKTAAIAILAKTLAPSVGADAASSAFLAIALSPPMNADAASPALLAHSHPSAMLTTVLPCFLFGWHFERNLYRRVTLFLERGVLFAAAATNEQSHGAAEARGGRAKKRQVTN